MGSVLDHLDTLLAEYGAAVAAAEVGKPLRADAAWIAFSAKLCMHAPELLAVARAMEPYLTLLTCPVCGVHGEGDHADGCALVALTTETNT